MKCSFYPGFLRVKPPEHLSDLLFRIPIKNPMITVTLKTITVRAMPIMSMKKKYGIRDYRGGGRSSARETASRVVAGAVAKQVLPTVKINAFVSSVGDIFIDKPYQDLDFSLTESNPVRCPDTATAAKMEEHIKAIRKAGDTVGGTITCVIQNVPT